MINPWRNQLNYDPIPLLLGGAEPTVEYLARRDLLEESVPPITAIWESQPVRRLLLRQLPTGSWRASSRLGGAAVGRGSLLEAFRHLRLLVEMYEMTCQHPAIEQAAEHIFAHQTGEGDIRGLLASQYAPYYTGALTYLLIKAGYGSDGRVIKALQWLLSMRQDDGGWVIGSPGMAGLCDLNAAEISDLTGNRQRATMRAFDRSKPFSAAGTGMVIRAFSVAAGGDYIDASIAAARLLKSKLLLQDNWSSYRHPDNWVRFQFPFWWTNLVSALDSLSLLGLPADDLDVRRGIEWLVGHQQTDGLWLGSYSSLHRADTSSKARQLQLWITLAICRILKRWGA